MGSVFVGCALRSVRFRVGPRTAQSVQFRRIHQRSQYQDLRVPTKVYYPDAPGPIANGAEGLYPIIDWRLTDNFSPRIEIETSEVFKTDQTSRDTIDKHNQRSHNTVRIRIVGLLLLSIADRFAKSQRDPSIMGQSTSETKETRMLLFHMRDCISIQYSVCPEIWTAGGDTLSRVRTRQRHSDQDRWT